MLLTILSMHISLRSLTAYADFVQVYISRSGQELSGQTAYRQYRKVTIKTSYANILAVAFCSHELSTFDFGRRTELGLKSRKIKLAARGKGPRVDTYMYIRYPFFISSLYYNCC